MVKRRKRKGNRKKPKMGLKTPLIIGMVAIFVFSTIALAVFQGPGPQRSVEGGSGIPVPILGNQHIEPGEIHIPYNSDPPTSGPHYINIARWGIHDTPIEKELQVHNLEDGGVIVQYNCKDLEQQTCDALISKLTEVVNRYDKTILAPYPDLDTVIALTAWGVIDKFNDFDENRIVNFMEAYIGPHIR